VTAQNEARPWLKLHPQGYPPELASPGLTALDLFERSVERNPYGPCVHYFETTLSYAEVDRAAGAFACALLDLGVKKGDRVIVQLQNIPQFLFAVLGTWKAGATVVPLNPMYRERELAFYCQDSGARVFVTMDSCGEDAKRAMAGSDVQHLITTSELDYVDETEPLSPLLRESRRVDTDGALDMAHQLEAYDWETPPPPGLTRDDIAYITYTSGTTGPPKGAMNLHGNVSYAATAFATAYGVTPEDRVLAMPPFIHVTGSICLLAVATLVGAPVICSFRFDAGEVLRLYPAPTDAEVKDAFAAALGDASFTVNARRSARWHAAAGHPTWRYFFAYLPRSAQISGLGATHGIEIPFVFGTLPATMASPEAQTLSDRMGAYWLAFARAGKPEAAGLPAWDAYDVTRDNVLVFDKQIGPQDHLRAEKCDLWDKAKEQRGEQ